MGMASQRRSPLIQDPDSSIPPLMAEGLSNREIAERLFVNVGTVKTHVHKICGKLGARSRTQAAAQARELGLLYPRLERPDGSPRPVRPFVIQRINPPIYLLIDDTLPGWLLYWG
jgi:hypothetical protein